MKTLIPKDFLTHLQSRVPHFTTVAPHIQMALAGMLWCCGSKRRQHTHNDGALSFHYTELNEWFGRCNFKNINDIVRLFDYEEYWRFRGYAVYKEQSTKAYFLSELAESVRDEYFNLHWSTATPLLIKAHIQLKTIPPAVASKDLKGDTTTAWRGAKGLNRVPVNLACLERLRAWLEYWLIEFTEGRAPRDIVHTLGNELSLKRLVETTVQVIRLSTTSVTERGVLIQRYVESISGRLFAQDVNLQNCPRIIRHGALAGSFDYDIENCHFAIAQQMAAKSNYQCSAINDYLANKEFYRTQIAKLAQITYEDTKTCLLALMYGARRSSWHENAIPECIGKAGAERLFKVDLFNQIAADINQARKVILAGIKLNQRGFLVNDFGKSINAAEHKPAQRLAHLIQGVEAKALKAAIDLYPENILLIQHDGFSSNKKLSAQAIADAMFDATGYRFEIKEEVIEVNPLVLPPLLSNENSFQTDLVVSANAGAGFGEFRRICCQLIVPTATSTQVLIQSIGGGDPNVQQRCAKKIRMSIK